MKIKVMMLLLVLIGMPISNFANKRFASPIFRGLNKGKVHIISNHLMEGSFNTNYNVLELFFKQDIDNVEVIIYKGDSVCEHDQEQNIKKEDFYNYLLAQYGAGQYTICVKVDGITVVEKTVTCK